ncbi:MAG: hypothetical protein AAFV45_05085 [Pseudomonadota bacterium]
MRINRRIQGHIIGALVVAGMVVPAQAEQLSESSARKFMEYAWSLVPGQFTPPNGKTITIDKTKKEEIVVPLDVAREVIRVGRMSAHAQRCDLINEQVLNYRTLMYREGLKKKWTEQQMVYISQLHLTTVMLLTGKVRIVEKQGDKEVEIDESAAKAATCSDEQKSKVREIIVAYVNNGPKFAKAESERPAATQQ